jgi:hypothetical protein
MHFMHFMYGTAAVLQLTRDKPALLLTDNNALRRVASAGELAGLIGPAHEAQHILGGCHLMPAATLRCNSPPGVTPFPVK